MDFPQLFSVSAFFIFTFLVFKPSLATDTLTPNQNFTDGQTLVSSNQIFELGFSSPGNSGEKYLAIRYYNIPLTVVWVANRNNPIRDSSGRLIIRHDGSLLLYNSSRAVVWSTNETIDGPSPILQLLDTGNLVVRKQGETDGKNYIWQSFDHMTDTMLPGMKLGWKLKTRTINYLRSWRSSDDPSDGEFTFSLETPETPQLILRMGSTKEYRWGPFDGDRFSGGNRLRNNTVFKPMFVSTGNEIYYTFETMDNSTLLRSVITPLGAILYLTWRKNSSREWSTTVEINRLYCDKYGMCGGNGNCYADDPPCKCLKGFVPRSPQDWRTYVYSEGCKRRYDLNCSNGDGFVKYNALKLPDSVAVWGNYSLEECKDQCLKKCDCMAYTRINPLGNGSQCVVWFGELIDLRDFPVGGEELYIRMARAELDSIAKSKWKKHMRVVVGITVLSAFVLILLAILGWYILRPTERREEDSTSIPIAHDRKIFLHYEEESQEDDYELPLFDLATIFAATDQFALGNKIGQGGFGPVYKGVLPNGSQIAVKRLSQNSGQGLREFKNEVILIAKLQHRNLVRLLGCCIQGEEKMLVYEYLPNKSLDNFIFDRMKRKLLPWRTRFNIILGIARGLLYLHQDSRLIIIHRDLKTSNILLDSEMNPKISDFGIARIFGGEQTEEKTRRIIGTYGYMSPEYAMSGHFSVKSDVFSFGVIVLEIISGRKNWGFYDPDHDYNLLGHTWKLWNEERSCELVEEILDVSLSKNEVIRCIQVALLCVQQRTEERPTMSAVVFMLSNENVELPQPSEPGFISERSAIKIDSSPTGQDFNTGNDITFTTVEGR